MVLEIGAANSLSFALEARRALSSVGVAERTARISSPGRELPSDFAVSRTAGQLRLSSEQAAVAVGTAIVAGTAILSGLGALRTALNTATLDGLTSPNTNFEQDGTRVSRVLLQSQSDRLVSVIDDLVASADSGNANLISSASGRVTIQTTEFGGLITISPLPLDSTGLGLADLSALSHDDAVASLARVETAIDTATARISALQSLQNNLDFSNGITQALIQVINGGTTNPLAPGALVDLSA